MPEEWKTFSVKTLDNNAPNTPISYAASLSEKLKDGLQNNTRLLLNPETGKGEIYIEGVISNYTITPVAIQEGDNSAKNRLTVSVQFTIFVSEPEEDKILLTCTRFVDYDSNTDLATSESTLLEEVSTQIVQDVINKLLSNW
jgi:outer membrane lipopolysaccharide assembly protein LptE/RlpB